MMTSIVRSLLLNGSIGLNPENLNSSLKQLLHSAPRSLDSRRRFKLLWDPYSHSLGLVFPDSIRILELCPAGNKESALVCRLTTHRLNDASLVYEALSYVWGDMNDAVSIDGNGLTLSITRNLEDALRQLRLKHKSRYLWVDAICINQRDTSERGHQVRLMRSIYKRAKNVLIWIGKDEPDHDDGVLQAPAAFEIIHSIVDHKRVAYAEITEIRSMTRTEMQLAEEVRKNSKQARKPLQYDPSWRVLEKMFSSPWFWRLWVVQEVVVASSATVIWGDSDIAWNSVGEAANWLKGNYPASRRHHIFGAYNAAYIYNLGMQARKGKLYPFFTIVVSTWLFESTDSRDRVFALLGLPNLDSDPDNGQLFLEPNYSLDESQIYLDLGRKVMTRERSLRLFNAVQHDPDEPLSLPSWVPRWRRRSMETLVPFDYINNKMSEYFEDDSSILTADPDLLVLRGFTIGTISSKTGVIPVESLDSTFKHTAETCNWVRKIESLLRRQSLCLTRSRLKLLCWTLTVGRGHDVWSSSDNHWHMFQAMWAYIMSNSYSLISGPSDCAIHAFLGSATYGRRLFITSDGMIGIGAPVLQEGDIVAVLLGGYTPFVLRPCKGHYLLVGECYFHGQMDGEAVDEYHSGEREAELFALR